MKPGEIEDIAERAFSRALARETARRVAVVVCGPMWLGATQADFTSMAAGAMSVYACNQSMSLFLPGSLRRGESAEDAAARRALTPSDGAVELSLDVDLDETTTTTATTISAPTKAPSSLLSDAERSGSGSRFDPSRSPAASWARSTVWPTRRERVWTRRGGP